MELKLHPYQERAVDLTVKHGAVYHMLDAGLGKTCISLKAIERIGRPALVFGPKLAVLHTWPEEIAKWTPHLSYTVLHGKNKDWKAQQAAGCDITLLNYDGFKWFFDACAQKKFKLRKFFTVFDESSMIRYNGWETKTGRLTRFGRVAKMMPIYSNYRICLSATPIPKGLIDLWGQYYVLDKGKRLGRSFYVFRDKYFNFSGHPHYKTTLKPGAADRIFDAIRDCTFQLNAEDHLDMPSLTQTVVRLPMTGKLKKYYEALEADYIVDVEGDTIVSCSQAVNDHKLRQLLQGGVYSERGTCLLKSPSKVEYLKEYVRVAGGQPTLAAIQFRFEYELICKEFNYEVPIIYGGQSAEKSAQYIKQWNKGKLPLLLVHPGSVKFSLNLQAGGSRIVWLALPWSYEDYYQLLRRLYRQGQQRGVTSHIVCFKDTIDEKVAKVLKMRAFMDTKLKTAMGKGGLK